MRNGLGSVSVWGAKCTPKTEPLVEMCKVRRREEGKDSSAPRTVTKAANVMGGVTVQCGVENVR